MGRSLRLAVLLYGVAALAYALDRVTKLWAESALAGRPPIRVIPGVLHLTYTTNPGGTFGFGGNWPWLFAAATVIIVAVIVAVSWRLPHRLVAVALGLVLGGALGNLTDRALGGPGLTGEVTDFIDLRVWPVFNLADSAIVVGAVLLAASSLVRRPEAPVRKG
jgi:signal peptidase II